MANSIKEGGLILHTIDPDGRDEVCYHSSGDSVPLGRGDAVKTAAGGHAVIGNGQYARTVARVAAGDPIYGVVTNCQQQFVSSSQNLNRTHCPASTAMYVGVRVANHRDEYRISEDGTFAAADIGENANLTGNGGGTSMTDCNSTTGLSTMMLDTSTHATTATLQVKTLRFDNALDNTPASANASIIVSLNNIERSGGTGTAGV